MDAMERERIVFGVNGAAEQPARLRLRPTRHARRSFLARASRAPSTRRSLVPSRRKPPLETWLNRPHALRVAPFGKDQRGSGRLSRLPPRRRRFGPVCVVPLICALAAPGSVQADGDAERNVSATSLVSSAKTRDLYPVVVIDRTEIELSGMRNLWDLLRSRVDYNYFGLHRPFSIDSFRLAILIDGRRISDSTYDLDAVPVAAVERIEIVGGSAVVVHGPQAIAGTINIVLRDGFEGVEVQAHGETPVDGGGEAAQASALWGGAVGAGHLTFGADVFRRNEIRAADRDYSRSVWTPGGSYYDTRWVSLSGNTAFIPVEVDGRRRYRLDTVGDCDGPGFTGPLTVSFGTPGEVCGFAWNEIAWEWEHRERQAAFLALDHPVGGGGSLYFDARVASTDVTRPYEAPTPYRISLPDGLDSGTGDDRYSLPPGTLVFHRFAGHGNRVFDWDLEEYDLTLGVEGRLGGGIGYDVHVRSFDWDVALDAATFVRVSAIDDAVENGTYDLANPLSTDPEHLAAIRRTGVRLGYDEFTKHRVARVAFDGSGFELGGGPLAWAVGAELVHEARKWDPVYRDGSGNVVHWTDVAGVSPLWSVRFHGERDRLSEFAELSLPLHGDLDVVLAGRHDEQNDVGSTVSRQLATRYRLNDGLSFRGSLSKSEKPPFLVALHFARLVTNPRIWDPATRSAYTVTAVNFGNPDLEPNDTDSVSLGIVSRLGPVTLSGDWYRTSISRLVAVARAQTIVNFEREHGRLPPGIRIIRYSDTYSDDIRDHPGCPKNPPPIPDRISCIVKPVTADGEFDISGIDLRAQWSWTTHWAEFDLDAHWSHVNEFEERAFDFSGPKDFPRNRVHVLLGATRGDLTFQWSAYATSGYRAPGYYSDGRYGGWVGHDLSVRWRDAFGIDATDITGGIMNVGNRGPTINSGDPEDPDETFDSIRGRTFFLTLKRSW